MARRVIVAVVTVVVITSVAGAIVYRDLSTPCTFMAQPGSLFLRVISDSNQTPISGAQVSATSAPWLCNGFPVAPKTTMTFVTNSTEWHYVGGGASEAAFSFDVKYAAHSYSFTESVLVEGVSCVTLFIPSGDTNVTWGTFQSTCPPRALSTSSSSTTSSSSAIITGNFTTTSLFHRVTFQQEGACSPAVYVAPWSVTLGNATESEPPNTQVQNGGYSAGPEPASVYTIAFSVPNGTYRYSVRPEGAFYSYTGTVTVNGADVSITLSGPVVSCTTTTAGTG